MRVGGRVPRGEAADETAAADGDENRVELRRLPRELEAERALAGDGFDLVERVHLQRAGGRRPTPRSRPAPRRSARRSTVRSAPYERMRSIFGSATTRSARRSAPARPAASRRTRPPRRGCRRTRRRRLPSGGWRSSRLAKAPRVLNEPACCSCSSLRVSANGGSPKSAPLRLTIGVTRMYGAMAAWTRSIADRSTATGIPDYSVFGRLEAGSNVLLGGATLRDDAATCPRASMLTAAPASDSRGDDARAHRHRGAPGHDLQVRRLRRMGSLLAAEWSVIHITGAEITKADAMRTCKSAAPNRFARERQHRRPCLRRRAVVTGRTTAAPVGKP